MKKPVTLPLQKLSYLKQVHLEFSMTGKHYEQLVTFQDDNPEQMILAILSDLVEEDASLLTEEEARYLFTLVKLSNIGPHISANVNCQNDKCKAPMKITFDLSTGDIKHLPKDFKVPEYKFKIDKDGEETTYQVTPPTLEVVVKFIDWFTQGHSISRRDLYSSEKYKNLFRDFKLKKNLLWLSLNGQRLFDNIEDFERMDLFLAANEYSNCANLFFDVQKLENYGLQPCLKKVKCEECGESNIFRLPLLFGLTS